MKRIFLDTNFILDYLVRAEFSANTEKVLKIGNDLNMEFYISFLTVANFAYIMRKMPTEDLRNLLVKICRTFHIVSNTESQILRNLEHPVADFEDGLQYQTALYGHCDCIITRNKNDFPENGLAVLTPQEFIASF